MSTGGQNGDSAAIRRYRMAVLPTDGDSRACVCIGVERTLSGGGLTFADLPGAVNGAAAVAKWARRMGFRTRLVVDRKPTSTERKSVTSRSVRTALTAVVPGDRPTSWLILYFAGHGTSFGGPDMWYVSDSAKERRVIDIQRLVQGLRRYNVARLTLISDACRNAAPADAATWTPDGLLGEGPADDRNSLSDVMKATSPFKEAFMVPAAVPRDTRCLFSGLLVEALWGMHPEALASPPRPTDQIVSSSLANFLDQAILDRAAEYSLAVTPDITTGLRYDNPKDGDVYARLDQVSTGRPNFPPWPEPTKNVPSMTTQPSAAEPPEFETTLHTHEDEGQRYVVFGTEEDVAVVSPLHHYKVPAGEIAVDIGDRTAFNYAAFNYDTPGLLRAMHAPIFMRLAGPEALWLPTTMHPTRLPTISVVDGMPQILSYRLPESPKRATQVEQLLAQMEAGELRAADANSVALHVLSDAAAEDPMLAVVAAYLYLAAADWDGIRRLAHAYCAADEPVPWDVAFLAHAQYRRSSSGRVRITVPAVKRAHARTDDERAHPALVAATRRIGGFVSGECPALRQGWRLLETASPLVRPVLFKARDHLKDSFITALDEHGAHLLAGAS